MEPSARCLKCFFVLLFFRDGVPKLAPGQGLI